MPNEMPNAGMVIVDCHTDESERLVAGQELSELCGTPAEVASIREMAHENGQTVFEFMRSATAAFIQERKGPREGAIINFPSRAQ